jgi:two-component sensor histidine kinase
MTTPEQKRRLPKKGILRRTAFIIWVVTLITITGFIVAIIPDQRAALLKSLDSTAKVTATSIGEVTASSIVLEDYSSVVDHCMRVLSENPLIHYIVITRKDGFSLIHFGNKWYQDNLRGDWVPVNFKVTGGEMKYSDLTKNDVFQYHHPLNYSGIDWGWIHIGLSLESYYRDAKKMYSRIILLGLISIFIGLLASIFFARRLNRPIMVLNAFTQKVAAGDLAARAQITTGDEVENLAESFNKMTEGLQKSQHELILQYQRNEEHFRSSLAEKEALLREIHHRVKNNLQLISSLLNLQAANPGKKTPRELFTESESRIRSLALIHESLYQSKNLSRIEFVGYLRELLVRLLQVYKNPGQSIKGAVEGNEIYLDITQAIPCGLIVNELVSNALKHAFPDRLEGEILVTIKKEGDSNYLIVRDNGVGLPSDTDLQNKDTLGLQIVTTLVNQLGGTLNYTHDGGTAYTLTF